MDDISKDYIIDKAMMSITSFKMAMDIVNTKQPDKSKRLTPTQKIKYLTEFFDEEYNKIMKEYDNCTKTT